MTEAEYYNQLRASLIKWRKSLGWGGQPKAARALGISTDSYKKLEVRDEFPLHLLGSLSVATGWRVDDIAQGRFGRLTSREKYGDADLDARVTHFGDHGNRKRPVAKP